MTPEEKKLYLLFLSSALYNRLSLTCGENDYPEFTPGEIVQFNELISRELSPLVDESLPYPYNNGCFGIDADVFQLYLLKSQIL